MKKSVSFALFGGAFLCLLSACIDTKYNIDDLDKTAVIGSDITVPVGELVPISLKTQIDDSYTGGDIKVENARDSVLYFEFEGEPVTTDLPNFDVPVMTPVEQTTPLSIQPVIGNEISIHNTDTVVLNKTKDEFVIEKPRQETGDGINKFEIDPKRVVYNKFPIKISAEIEGVSLSEGGKFQLIIEYPDNFGFRGSQIDTMYIGEPVPNKEIDTLTFADTDAGDYAPDSIAYTLKAVFSPGATDKKIIFDLSSPQTFTLKMEPVDAEIEMDYLECSIAGKDTIQENIGDIAEFGKAFEGQTMEFKNPSLELDFKTNLGADFTIDSLIVNDGLLGTDTMWFPKPTDYNSEREVSYTLSPINADNLVVDKEWKEFGLDALFEGSLPDSLKYRIVMSINDTLARLAPEGNKIDVKYKFKLPFTFNDLDFTIADTLQVFPDNMYDDFFKNINPDEGITISAKIEHNMAVILDIDAQILKENNTDTGVNLGDTNVLFPDGTLTIKISGRQNIAKMKDARNLGLTFKLKKKESGTQLTSKDVIHVKDLKLKLAGGIAIEL
ncbi:hypothetical protein AGMMS49982_15920 [Bacteroidia bacterium]|nr:hypothetical protein AGMMS49982_15920 [Bacteroidia bacterium]